MEALRLPKLVENAPGASHLATELAVRVQPLWPGGELRVPQAEMAPALEAALKSAFSAGHIVRGLADADRALEAEERGMRLVDQRTGVERGRRVSRLVVVANDGAERFYRNLEALLRRHAPRVLGLRLSANEHALGQLLFGPDQVARLLLVEHKDAVSAVLLALAACWKRG